MSPRETGIVVWTAALGVYIAYLMWRFSGLRDWIRSKRRRR